MSTEKKRRDPHVFDDSKLYLYAPAVKAEARKVRLRIKLYENNPVFDVDYGHKTEKGYQVSHETPIDPQVLGQILEMIRMVSRAKGQVAFTLDNWGHPFLWDKELGKNQRSKERKNISQIEIGKHESGEVYLKYKAVAKPEVEFVFSDNSDYHRLMMNGNPMPSATQSPICAIAWAEAMSNIYYTYYSTKWEEPEWRKRSRLENMQRFQSGGQGGNKNYGNNGGNQQYNQPPQTSAHNDDGALEDYY